MNENGSTDVKSSIDHDGNTSYAQFDRHSTISTCSSIVLSSCASNEEKDDNNRCISQLQWRRQQILNTDSQNSDRLPSGNDATNNLHNDRQYAMSAKENIAISLDDERRPIPPRRVLPIPEDKLHRRNPHTVRQELKMIDDFIPEITLAEVHLSEMPGLQNTEQWKRIAGRTVHPSPPLSRQYYQTVVSTVELQDGQVPQSLGSYRRPGRSESEQDLQAFAASVWRAPRRRLMFGSSVAVVILAIAVAIVVAITLIKKASPITSNYYEGSVYVRAAFDATLLDPTSTMARSYKKEFCLLIRRTLVGARKKYARSYSTCSIIGFHNGSIIADFVLGFKHRHNVTRLNSYLNRTLVNQTLFGGSILSIAFETTDFITGQNNSNSENDEYDEDGENSGKFIMENPSLVNESQQQQQQPTQTSYTTVTYKALDTGLSITISETITITNNNFDKLPINNKNYELILVPASENTKTVVVPSSSNNEKTLLPPPVTTTDSVTKSSSNPHLLRPIKPINDANFAYIDESSDEPTKNSRNEKVTIESYTSSASTSSINDGTLTDSTSTIADNLTVPPTSNPPPNPIRPPKPKDDDDEDSGEKRPLASSLNKNVIKQQRRMVRLKKHRRLLQYELMPTGKVYYVDPPFHNESKHHKDDNDSNSSNVLSAVLSRSSSLDTLSDKRYRHNHNHNHNLNHNQHQQRNRKYHPNLSLQKPEEKLPIGRKVISNNNLVPPSASSFKPINTNKKKRFSSFEPTPESLDQVFDVLIAADKRREEHEFWREKFDHRTTTSRTPIVNHRIQDTTNSYTIPSLRTKQTHLTVDKVDNRSQSYINKRNSAYDTNNRQSDCLLEDCLRRRTLMLQQQQQQQHQPQRSLLLQPPRNYSPNTIYSTNYPKQQLASTGKPPLPTTTVTNQQPVRILPLTNGRVGRAPQARQTSDELSSVSDVWAARSSIEEEAQQPKKSINHARFQSVINRNRANEQKPLNNKRASSVEQQKSNRTQNKNLTTTKSKFFDLFKFTR